MKIRMWWYRPLPNLTNFGDELGAAVVQKMGYEVERVPLEQADLVGAGSILGITNAKARPGTIVWGSGFIFPTDTMDKARFDIRALRGRLSADKIGVDVPLGDPGILVPRLWDAKHQPVHKVGVIPHYVDKNTYSWADKVIDPTEPVDAVIRNILSCSSVASSSLHGLIVAEAYGVPAVRLYHPDVAGNEFKWVDYVSGLAGKSLTHSQDTLIKALDL